MTLFGHTLSNNALSFVKYYENKLIKEIKYVELDNRHTQWGAFEDAGDFYVLGINPNMPSEAFNATFCHEFYHAYQFSQGFPTVIAKNLNAPDVKQFTEHLRSNILDLSADDAVREYRLDDSFVMRNRYKQLKQRCRANFSDIDNQFKKDMLSIDLILDFHSITEDQMELTIQKLKECIPEVYSQYSLYQLIVDKYGYKTPDGCLNIYGYILNSIDFWPHCYIIYQNKKIRTLEQFKKVSSSEV